MTATCPSIRAHWHYLANTFELVHPSTHSSPQSKRQMDRFSCFCTAYGTKYTLQLAPLSTRIAPSHGDLDLRVTHDAFGHCELTTQTTPRSVQPSLHRRPRSVSIVYNGLPVSPSKLPLPMVASGPHVMPQEPPAAHCLVDNTQL